MKHTLLFLCLLGLLSAGCDNGGGQATVEGESLTSVGQATGQTTGQVTGQQQEQSPERSPEHPEPPQPPVERPREQPQDYAPHSSMNSLDYFGEYRAGEPEAEISRIILSPWGRYSLTTNDGREAEGDYQWDVTGTTISLIGDGEAEVHFFVGENYLKRIDSGPDQERLYQKQTTGQEQT